MFIPLLAVSVIVLSFIAGLSPLTMALVMSSLLLGACLASAAR